MQTYPPKKNENSFFFGLFVHKKWEFSGRSRPFVRPGAPDAGVTFQKPHPDVFAAISTFSDKQGSEVAGSNFSFFCATKQNTKSAAEMSECFAGRGTHASEGRRAGREPRGPSKRRAALITRARRFQISH